MDESVVLRILDRLDKLEIKLNSIQNSLKPQASDAYQTDSIVKISTALANAQGDYAPLVATALMKGKLRDYKYDELGELMRVVTPTLKENGLAIHVIRKNVDGAVVAHITLRHSSGEWIESRMRIPSNNETIHEYQSLVNFHVRSIIKDILGCYPLGEDDDGQEAMKRVWANADKGTSLKMQSEGELKGPVYEPITKKELDELHEELKTFEDIIPEILKTFQIRTLSDMDTKDWSGACKRIRYLKALRTGAMK